MVDLGPFEYQFRPNGPNPRPVASLADYSGGVPVAADRHSGATALAAPRLVPPSGGLSMMISVRESGIPMTVVQGLAFQGIRVPSSSGPSPTKNAVTVSRSVTVMPTWSKRHTCDMGPSSSARLADPVRGRSRRRLLGCGGSRAGSDGRIDLGRLVAPGGDLRIIAGAERPNSRRSHQSPRASSRCPRGQAAGWTDGRRRSVGWSGESP